MSKLTELLEGVPVEWKTLGKVAVIKRGSRLIKSQLEDSGEYAVFQNSMIPLGYYHESNVQGDTTFIISAGSAGEIGYSNDDFWAADDVYYFITPENLSSKFLYYFLLTQQCIISGQVRRSSVPRLSKTAFEKMSIPIPPLAAQKEIVRILDTFTKRTETLINELTTELEARKKQYNYYREKLLSFKEGEVEWKTLGEVILSLKTGLNPRQNFQLNTNDATGFYITVREIQNGYIKFSEKTDRVNERAIELINNRSNLDAGDILFSGTGTVGRTAVIYKKPVDWNIKEGVYVIKPIPEIINSKYLSHLLNTNYIIKEYSKKIVGSPVISLPMNDFKKLSIPIPSIEDQERIVAILDKLESLTTSISEALPKEIALRKKQYEYYRDRLLTFK